MVALLLSGLGLAVAIGFSGLALFGAGPEAAVQKLLLTLHQFLQFLHRLLRLTAALLHLPRLRRSQVFEHLLKLREQFAGLVARAVARHLAGAIQHLLQIATGEHLGGVDRLLRLLGRVPAHFLGHGLQVAVERLAQFLHQALYFLIGRALGERFLKLLLQAAQIALGEREIAVLDAQRGVPEQLRNRGNRLLAVIGAQSLLRHAKPEIDDAIIAEQRRTAVQIPQDFGDRLGRLRVFRQLLALIDDCARHRMAEFAFR